MNLRKLLLVPAVLAVSGLTASADTLVLENGRSIHGELVSISRGIVVFNEMREDGTRVRRMRVALDRVESIDFRDEQVDTDDEWTTDRDSDTSRFGRQRAVTVRADQQWTDTGIDLRAGQTVRFDVQGTIVWGPGRQDGPEGEVGSPVNSRRPVPSRSAGALVGRIGTGNDDVFFIGGDRGSFRVRTSGRLYLGVNDDYLQDNSGNFRVTVEH